ncbi:MAG: GxxExxY protein [Chloroflexi bacterium]|nr:MAG: GxxExxY protein [Chloroflexota bacterium]
MLYADITEKIIRGFYQVYNTLGYGFLEKVYENALAVELSESGLRVCQQHPVTVYYNGKAVGNYFADMGIDDKIIVELKAAETLRDEHRLQLLNYLRATGKQVGLLLNFGKKPAFKRVVASNKLKPNH